MRQQQSFRVSILLLIISSTNHKLCLIWKVCLKNQNLLRIRKVFHKRFFIFGTITENIQKLKKTLLSIVGDSPLSLLAFFESFILSPSTCFLSIRELQNLEEIRKSKARQTPSWQLMIHYSMDQLTYYFVIFLDKIDQLRLKC